jgi:hypothetical protein
MSGARGALAFLAVVASAPAVGCGGGLPLLHPARTLPQGEVRAAAGFSGNIAVGGFNGALRNAANDAAAQQAASGPTAPDSTFAKGALVAASVAPGLAPYAAARVGIGAQSEGGVAYTGRAVRIDLRHSFDLSRTWALSVGAGGSAVFYGQQQGSPLPDVDLGALHGYGADVPFLVGYQSDGDLYMVWAGARAGWEHVDISDLSSVPNGVTVGPTPFSLSATRFWGGGLLGLAVGFRHVHVAMELDASYATIDGQFGSVHATVAGVTVAPSTALWWDF